MQTSRIMWVFVSVVVVFTIAASVTTIISRGQQNLIQTCEAQTNPSQEKQTQDDFKNHYPVVDYNAPEIDNPQEREERKVKGRRYDKGRVGREFDDTSMVTDFKEDFSESTELPIAESSLVVIGKVIDAKAYLSSDKTGVYTEFTIRISELLKNNTTAKITQGSFIGIDREGGTVRYPDGQTIYLIAGEAMPRLGKEYVLFLNNPDQSPNYEIVTGFELKANKVSPLYTKPQFQRYKEMDVATFKKAINDAIERLQGNPKQ